MCFLLLLHSRPVDFEFAMHTNNELSRSHAFKSWSITDRHTETDRSIDRRDRMHYHDAFADGKLTSCTVTASVIGSLLKLILLKM